jgi:cytosine/adenosine deaminase-related metal-dependent hydrolase
MILAAGWVLPIGAPPIRDGRVAVEAGRVTWVGASGESGMPAGPVRELGRGVLMPGLVNAHCHLELSYLRGKTPWTNGFVPWVESVVAARGTVPEAEMLVAAQDAIVAMARHGTAAVADVSNTLLHVAALRASGLRAIVLHELLGWDPAAAPAIMEGALQRIASLEAPGRVSIRIAAHAPHSVSPRLLALMVERGGPAGMHLAESPEEVAFLRDGNGAWGAFLARRGLSHVAFDPPGTSPVAYADAAGALHPGLIAAHCVQAGGTDHALLAKRGAHVVVCPRSNANLGVGQAPLPDLLAAGVNVCVGTDSLASAESLDVLDDVLALRRAFPDVAPATLLRMATANGAVALGLEDLGAIAPGMAAALAYAPSSAAVADPEAFVVSGAARLRTIAV